MNGHIDNQLIKSVCKEIQGNFTFTFTATGVCVDSHRIKKGEIFVPIQGKLYDGHQFIEAAIENGAVATFWQEGVSLPKTVSKEFPVFIVDDPLQALRWMSDEYLFDVDPTTIAVTGDYTKKITKKILAKLLHHPYNVHEVPQKSGDELSVMETILSMSREADVLICEVSEKSKHMIHQVSNRLKPSFSIISEFENQGDSFADHIEDGMKASGTVLINGDLTRTEREWKTDVVSIGFGEDNIFQISNHEVTSDNVTFQIEGVRMMDFQLPVLLSEHVRQSVLAIALSIQLGLTADKIYSSLVEITLEDLSIDPISSSTNSVVLFDHEFVEKSDVEYSLGMLRHLHSFTNRVLIVDEGFQASPLDKTLHETFASRILPPITEVVTIGEKAFWVTEALNRSEDDKLVNKHFINHAKAIDTFKEMIESSSLILYRGANRKLLEQIIEELNRS